MQIGRKNLCAAKNTGDGIRERYNKEKSVKYSNASSLSKKSLKVEHRASRVLALSASDLRRQIAAQEFCSRGCRSPRSKKKDERHLFCDEAL